LTTKPRLRDTDVKTLFAITGEHLLKMSAPDPSISIIIPTRNEVENIAPLVSQIIIAAVPLHEIVFVDANSTDGTLDIIRSLAAIHPIRLIEQDPAAPGLAAAITAGAAAAKSELLLVMDADSSNPLERINDLLGPLRTEFRLYFGIVLGADRKISFGIAFLFFWRWILSICRRLCRN